MAGISDIRHELCLALALWNGQDPILKERMFGLTGPQGNHGEDVKEYWWYLEGLPSHALLRWRYHYPQVAFPVRASSSTTAAACTTPSSSCSTPARSTTTATGRSTSPTRRPRRRRSWRGSRSRTTAPRRRRWRCCRRSGSGTRGPGTTTPSAPGSSATARPSRVADHALAGYRLEGAPGPDGAAPEALFCENETNAPRVFGSEATTPYPKDGINDHVVSGAATVNPEGFGTKAALRYRVTVPGGGKAELRLRLHRPRRRGRTAGGRPTGRAPRSTRSVAAREADADEFYGALAPAGTTPETMRVLRQACAGLVWSKQIYPYNVRRWLDGDPGEPPPPEAHRHGRNSDWRHLDAFDVLAMPDPVGVPVVRRLGPRLPRGPLGAPRSRVREVPARRPAARVVPAPERRAAGVRVELRRRQPAGARDGGAPRLPHRRRPRPRVPRAHLPEAARQLHVVAQPRGRRRQQRLQRRLPRARQHQPDRPLEPPGGRHARAGRRHGVDGLLRALDARDRDRARGGERRLPGHGDQVPRAVRADRAGARAAGPLRPRGRVLLRPARVPLGRAARR